MDMIEKEFYIARNDFDMLIFTANKTIVCCRKLHELVVSQAASWETLVSGTLTDKCKI